MRLKRTIKRRTDQLHTKVNVQDGFKNLIKKIDNVISRLEMKK